MSEEKREYNFKPFEELTFTDGFIFYIAMQDEEICKGVIEHLLGIKIKKIEYLNTEQTFKIGYETKSIRLDVYTEGDGRIFDVEVLSKIASLQFLKPRIFDSCSAFGQVLRTTVHGGTVSRVFANAETRCSRKRTNIIRG